MKLVAALLALVFIGGCGGEPQPNEPKASSSASPTPTIAAPTMPASASEDTPSGAANFAFYFVAIFNHAAQTGDSKQMLAIAQDCGPCKAYAEDFTRLRRTGRLAKGLVWKLSDVSVSTSRNPVEVDGTVSLLDGTGDGPYRVTFVLNDKAPFEIHTLKLRDQQ